MEKGDIAHYEQFLLFSHDVFKSCPLLMRQNDYLWSNGMTFFFFSLFRRHFFLSKISDYEMHLSIWVQNYGVCFR